MKKRGTIFLCLIVLLFATIGIVACEVEHTHAFTVKSVDERYLASPATCAQPATYYYSCMCGETGTATFTIGNALQHTYSIEWSYNQTEHWHAATCGHNVESDRAAHSYDGSNTCTVCKFNCAKAVTNIFLNKRELSLDVGKEEKLLTTVLPLDVAGTTLTWNSTAPLVASVKDGTVTALAKGTAVIIAACGEVSATCAVTVTDSYENFAFSRSGDSYTLKSYLGARAEVEIPSTYNGKPITAIGNSAFEYCTTLTKVTISDSVTSIGSSAFAGCRSLTNVTIPNSVQTINDKAFEGCISLANITIPEGITSIGGRAFSGCSDLISITIPEGITSIGGRAFSGCSDLISITIPDGVTTIDDCTFLNCSKLASVTIGSGVTTIGNYAFENCDKLENIYITDIAAWCKISGIGNLMRYGSSNKKLYLNNELLTDLVIPGSVTSIDWYAFRGCSGLTSITISDSVTSIGSFAFSGCSGLTSVIIGSRVTSIGDWAFYECGGLVSITIPDSVTSIGNWAFEYCSSLTSVIIGSSVTSIGMYAFYGCDSLTSVTYKGTMAQWKAIEKGENWNDGTGNYTIHCSDGDIVKS